MPVEDTKRKKTRRRQSNCLYEDENKLTDARGLRVLPELRLASPGITVYTFNRRRVWAHGGVVRFVYG